MDVPADSIWGLTMTARRFQDDMPVLLLLLLLLLVVVSLFHTGWLRCSCC
jgi:hypothetical protein